MSYMSVVYAAATPKTCGFVFLECQHFGALSIPYFEPLKHKIVFNTVSSPRQHCMEYGPKLSRIWNS